MKRNTFSCGGCGENVSSQRTGSRPVFENGLNKLGKALQLSDRLWLLQGAGTAGSVRNELLQHLGPRDKLIDLLSLTQNIMQGLAVGLLFGGEYERAESVTRMIELQNDAYRTVAI